MDPLSLLRSYVINKTEIVERNDEIILGDFSWPKKIKTNFLMWSSKLTDEPKDYYTLETIVLFLKTLEYNHTIHVREAAAKEIPPVRRPDRKDLMAYLKGEIATCGSIDKSVNLNFPNIAKRTADSNPPNDKSMKKPKLEEGYVQKVKEEFATRLETPKEASVSINKIKSLSDAMSVEKIAEIKAKRLANKRTTVKENDDAMVKRSDMTVLLDSDVDVTKDILSREREWRNRSTILQANEKDFGKDILPLLSKLKIREEQKGKQPLPKIEQARRIPPLVNSSSYNRYDQERFNQKQETDGFKINTMGSYHGLAMKSVTKEGKVELKVTDVAPRLPLQDIRKPVKRVSRTPIIIIPPTGTTSLISMPNAKEILQDFKFVTAKQKKSEGCQHYTDFVLQRQRGSLTVPYLVIDNPLKLSREDWDRVVAVFVMGPTWQFKSFPWKDPVEIFSKICAFHIKYDDMKVDGNVGRWAVTVINLSRTRRHLDRAAMMVFWEKLDRYMRASKPHLRF